MHHSFIDRYSNMNTPIHRADPRAKIIVSCIFILAVATLPNESVLKFCLYLLLIFITGAISGVPISHIALRVATIYPFVAMIAFFMPLIHHFNISRPAGYGWWVAFGIFIKSSLCAGCLALLISTTRFANLLKGLEKLKVPSMMIAVLSFMYRFIFILIDDAMKLHRAILLRSNGNFSMNKIKIYGNAIGVLFIKTYGRAERVYYSMVLRGFDGEIKTINELKFTITDSFFCCFSILIIIAIRIFQWEMLLK